MTVGRSALLIGAAVALLLGAGGAPADPLPQGAAAPSAASAWSLRPTKRTPPPQPVTEQNDVPAAAPKRLRLPNRRSRRRMQPPRFQKMSSRWRPPEAFSVLGKKVHGPDGKDVMGLIIDILVDDQGRPRAAIVDFGGFLGVGSRKIAVDWQLMKFHVTDKTAEVILDLDRSQIQAAPEYKDPTQPAEVVEPAVAGASAPGAPGAVAAPATQGDQAAPTDSPPPVPPATPAPPAVPIAPPVDSAAQPDAEKHPN